MRPSDSVTVTESAPATTWLLVRIRPSELMITPEPMPSPFASRTLICTTLGVTFATTADTSVPSVPAVDEVVVAEVVAVGWLAPSLPISAPTVPPTPPATSAAAATAATAPRRKRRGGFGGAQAVRWRGGYGFRGRSTVGALAHALCHVSTVRPRHERTL